MIYLNAIINTIQVILEFYFLKRFTMKTAKIRSFVLFVLISLAVMFSIQSHPSIFLNVVSNILLMILMSFFVLKNNLITSLAAAIIASEIMLLSFGMFNSLVSISSPLIYNFYGNGSKIMQHISFMSMWVALIFAFICYYLIQKYFPLEKSQINQYTFLMLLPLMLIFFSGEYISGSVYGSTLYLNSSGEIMGINHKQMAFIQALAICSIFSVLFAYKKLYDNFNAATEVKMLEQEAHIQREYVEETKSRYEKTQSFRHDFKNHMLILRGIIEKGNLNEAISYLNKLDNVTNELSFLCHTNNAILDILLSSKLSLAQQIGIKVKCSFELPEQCAIDVFDMCIVFSNALDNAINACKLIEDESKRYIDIMGSSQGDFLMMQMENSCLPSESKNIDYGIGLSNVKGVMERYGGALNTELIDETFKLNALFNISQHH